MPNPFFNLPEETRQYVWDRVPRDTLVALSQSNKALHNEVGPIVHNRSKRDPHNPNEAILESGIEVRHQ